MKEGIVARIAPDATTDATMASADPGIYPARPETAGDHFLVISGLSGAGKSQASKLFEDLGYSCVDNLPPALLDHFLALRREEP